jgi:hypothetical protein
VRSEDTCVDPVEALKVPPSAIGLLTYQHQFLNAVSASLIGGPDFYNRRDPVRLVLLDMAERITKMDVEFVLKTALYTRQVLNIRATANFLFAFAAHCKGQRRPHLSFILPLHPCTYPHGTMTSL